MSTLARIAESVTDSTSPILSPPDVRLMSELGRMRREGRTSLNEVAVLLRIVDEKLASAQAAFPVRDEGTQEMIDRIQGNTAMSRHLLSTLITAVG